MFPPTDSAKSAFDLFPTTDNVKDINPPRSLQGGAGRKATHRPGVDANIKLIHFWGKR